MSTKSTKESFFSLLLEIHNPRASILAKIPNFFSIQFLPCSGSDTIEISRNHLFFPEFYDFFIIPPPPGEERGHLPKIFALVKIWKPFCQTAFLSASGARVLGYFFGPCDCSTRTYLSRDSPLLDMFHNGRISHVQMGKGDVNGLIHVDCNTVRDMSHDLFY